MLQYMLILGLIVYDLFKWVFSQQSTNMKASLRNDNILANNNPQDAHYSLQPESPYKQNGI